MQQREHVIILQFLAAFEEIQFDYESQAADFRA